MGDKHQDQDQEQGQGQRNPGTEPRGGEVAGCWSLVGRTRVGRYYVQGM